MLNYTDCNLDCANCVSTCPMLSLLTLSESTFSIFLSECAEFYFSQLREEGLSEDEAREEIECCILWTKAQRVALLQKQQ